MAGGGTREGLKLARLMMVLSGMSPLFVLWAVRGMKPIADVWWVTICALMVAVPNLILAARLAIAKKGGDTKMLQIGEADDCRDHLLVYLFAMVMPLYDVNVSEPREACAMLAALLFIVFLFWHLNLHYMNFAFAVFGYRVYTIYPPESDNSVSGHRPFVILTKRTALKSGEKINAVRISNSVFWEP